MEPQRDLCQFDRHGVLVDPVDAALEHHTADDVAIIKLFGIYDPASLFGMVEDGIADAINPLPERRNIIAPLNNGLSLGHRGDHPVGQIVDQADKEVARTHGWIADFEFEQPFSRIESLKLPDPEAFLLAVFRQVCCPIPERVQACVDQRLKRFPDDQADQLAWRIETARTLARENVGADNDVTLIANHLMFKQTFVD